MQNPTPNVFQPCRWDEERRTARYARIVNEGVAMEYAEGNDVAIRFDYIGVARHSDRHQIEFLVTLLVRLCRQLAAKRLQPIQVKFTHRRTGDFSEMNSFFGCGMTFSGVVERLRSALAERYLKNQSLSISQIAWLLGYQEVSAFTHAFKRWTGRTPRDIRGEQKSSARGS